MDLLFLFVVCIPLTVLILLLYLRIKIRSHVRYTTDLRLDGKTVVITGANSGIGKATATELAKLGARVFLACRNQGRAETALRDVRLHSKSSDVHITSLDLASLNSVKKFVDDFMKEEGKLDILINNAAYIGPREITEDGLDRTVTVNFLGHFLLTNLFIQRLKPSKTRPFRVINMASDAYRTGSIDFRDFMYQIKPEKYRIYPAYARSKLAMVLFTSELHYRHGGAGVITLAVHPGAVCTGLQKNWPGLFGQLIRGMAKFLFRTPEQGAQTVVYAAVEYRLDDCGGRLYTDCKEENIKEYIADFRQADKLWLLSEAFCGMRIE